MSPKVRRLLAPLLIASGCLLLALVALGDLSRVTAQTPPPKPPTLPSGLQSDPALKKLHPALRGLVRSGGERVLAVRVDTAQAVDLSPYVEQSYTRAFAPLGETAHFARVRADRLVKLAGLPGVVRVTTSDLSSAFAPPPPVDPDAYRPPSEEDRQARLKQLRAVDKPWSAAPAEDPVIRPASWYDAGRMHDSSQAWGMGYQGEGVKVAVVDSGVDLAHPDLLGTWAVVEDPASPYYGWPIAFDPMSMRQYVDDVRIGTTYVKEGSSWYIDTSATPSVIRSEADIAAGRARMRFTPFTSTGWRGPKPPSAEREFIFGATSLSGVYHIGNHPDLALASLYGEHVGVLLVDEQSSGVYDTVYVDLDNDHDFTDEKPVTRASPAAYRDLDGDGLADISGGIVYFIADGAHPIPGFDWFWGRNIAVPGNAALVAFMGSFEGSDHGTSCASNIVAQGRINGKSAPFADLPGDGRPPSAVVGAAPEAQLVAVGNIYYGDTPMDAQLLCALGYDGLPNSGDECQITSNSYGWGGADDGWDYRSRDLDYIVRHVNPNMAILSATGNGGAGYGTMTVFNPSTGMQIGASTQFGSTGWDSITRTSQIQWGNVVGWSNRGPGATGGAGVDVVASGAFAAGNIALNKVLNGQVAWKTWGGTSRATPVAAGNLALAYQAFKANTGRWPTYQEAKALLKSSATSLTHDAFMQGVGMVNGGQAAALAGGHFGLLALPDEWAAGGYRGQDYSGFASIIHPGASDSQTFQVRNMGAQPVAATLSTRTLRRIGAREFSFASKPVGQESAYNFNVPDYLIPLDDIPASANLMVVHAIFPLDRLDPNGDYNADQVWRLLIYDWTDIDGDGRLWDDRNGDGVVNHANAIPARSSNIDGYPDLDWSHSEVDRWEYTRVTYAYNTSNKMTVLMSDPARRASDGLFLGLQHWRRSNAIPTTEMRFRVEFYQEQPWEWLSLPTSTVTVEARSAVSVTATLNVPADAPHGAYQGYIVAEYAARAPFSLFLPHIEVAHRRGQAAARIDQHGAPSQFDPTRRLHIPVVASVAARYDGRGSLTFGGAAAERSTSTYNNGATTGEFGWEYGGEAGDWRFFFLDVLQGLPEGARLLSRNIWQDSGPPTDIDTLVYGPKSDRYSDPAHPDNQDENRADPAHYGPYTLGPVFQSQSTDSGGAYRFDTTSGGAEELLGGELAPGLHLLMLHNVLYSGQRFSVPYTMTVGTVNIQPTVISATLSVTSSREISYCMPLTFTTSLPLPGLVAEGFGMSAPQALPDQVSRQDDGDDPRSASYRRTLTLTHASTLTVRAQDQAEPEADIDLYVLRDADGDGQFSYPDEVVGQSTSPTGTETVTLSLPPDGVYQVWVLGWTVPNGEDRFTLTIDAVQGRELSVSSVPTGPIPVDQPVRLQVCIRREVTPGDTLRGEILIGPPGALHTLSVPVVITATQATP